MPLDDDTMEGLLETKSSAAFKKHKWVSWSRRRGQPGRGLENDKMELNRERRSQILKGLKRQAEESPAGHGQPGKHVAEEETGSEVGTP